MNFTNVKGISIPQGTAKSLAIGGETVWGGKELTWEAVFASMDAGTYATDYAIGDTVPLDLGSEGVINMQIAAFDKDDLADSSDKAKISWVAKELLSDIRTHCQMLKSETDDSGAKVYVEGTGSIGGWEKSGIRSYLRDTIKPLIPELVANRIAAVVKAQKSFDTAGEYFVQTTEDDVWIPGSSFHGTVSSHEYLALFPDRDSAKKCKVGETTAQGWYLREADSAASYWSVADSGGFKGKTQPSYSGVCLCFCTN